MFLFELGIQANIQRDGRNPAPLKKAWNDDSPVTPTNIMASHSFKVVQDSVHLPYVQAMANASKWSAASRLHLDNSAFDLVDVGRVAKV